MSEALTSYGDGATRSSGCPAYSVMPPEVERAVAERWTKGLWKHGYVNFKRGMPVAAIIDHIRAHLNAFMLGEDDPDSGESIVGHMAGIICGASMIIWASFWRPELIAEFRAAMRWDGRGEPPPNPYPATKKPGTGSGA